MLCSFKLSARPESLVRGNGDPGHSSSETKASVSDLRRRGDPRNQARAYPGVGGRAPRGRSCAIMGMMSESSSWLSISIPSGELPPARLPSVSPLGITMSIGTAPVLFVAAVAVAQYGGAPHAGVVFGHGLRPGERQGHLGCLEGALRRKTMVRSRRTSGETQAGNGGGAAARMISVLWGVAFPARQAGRRRRLRPR